MKRSGWEWANSNKKKAAQIMWDTQGQELDVVCEQIMEACNVNLVAARALYRKVARDDLIDKGFVPAPAKVGRPRKDGSNAAPAPVVYREPEPEPERTETGEKKSIADMKAYLESLKRKAG